MTGLYVASNVSALGAQIQLQRNMSDLGDVLTRLSTGLRINSGKDDPAGLIASELLKSDITATNMAIKNTQRANNVIAIADSALGQVSSLLNDIRGLVNEAANTGAMTSEQIYANQLQVNASLDSIDRISKTTNFQGKLLLDGSLDFATSGVDRYAIRNLEIQQANFGSMDAIDIKVNINRAAEPARLYFNQGGVSERTILEVGGVKGSNTFTFQAGASVVDMANAINAQTDSLGVRAVVGQEATYGQLLATSAGYDNDINFTSVFAGAANGAYSIKYSAGNTDETYYKLTEPTLDVNGNIVKSGEIEFFLKMDKAGYSQISDLDEAYNDIHTAMLPISNTASENMVIQSDNGYIIRTFEVVQTTGAGTPIPPGATPAVDFDPVSGHLKILANSSATNIDIANVINQIDGLKVIQEGTSTALAAAPVTKTATTDVRANNSLAIKSLVAGDKYENTDIIFVNGTVGNASNIPEFEYTDSPKNASLTIANDATPASGTQFLKLSARGTGTQYNDIAVVFDPLPTPSPLAPGEVSVTYDADNKIMHIMGQIDGNPGSVTLGKLKEAIEANTPFRADFYNETDLTTKSNLANPANFAARSNNDGNGLPLKTGQTANSMGTSHQALIVTVDSTKTPPTTAQDIVNAFLNDPLASKFSIINANGSNGSGTIFLTSTDYTDPTLYTEPTIRIYAGALTGATSGSKTNVTAQELVDFVNNDEVLRNIIQADLGLNTPNGNGKLTIFDEFAYYGDPNLETGLQFLGPEGSKPIIFDDGNKTPNQRLDMYFSPDVLGYAQTSIAAQNANAAIQINARNKGTDYDDMVVRYVALDANATEGYVNYTEGESNSMAYCSIESADTGTAAETGKFILYANDPGSIYNNVNIVAKLDLNQGDPAKAYFDKNTNQFIISVNSNLVTLSQAMAAIEADGTFTADYDFSYNNQVVPTVPGSGTGPGDRSFANLLGSTGGSGSITSAIIGNTGETGGHKGGVLTIALATNGSIQPDSTTHQYDPLTYTATGTGYSASDVVALINKDSVAKNLFTAANYPGSTGLGAISFRDDNTKTITGGDGLSRIVPSAVSTGGIVQEGYMVIQLATDAYGNSVTTARDIVNLFDSLTEEQTRGVSVSLVRPAGQDNLLRTWTDDGCGNITVTQECEDDFGKGIIQPTTDIDDCNNIVYYPLEFTSYGSDIRDTVAQGDIISVNGWESQFRVTARNAGTQYENTSIVYRAITDGSDVAFAEWDPLEKQIIVHVSTNTNAADVKAAIESGVDTGNLFKVDLKVNGSALVTLTDDALLLKNGTYEAGYRGGAHMLGAADADAHSLTFESTEEGSAQFVRVNVIEGNPKIVDEKGIESNRAVGVDIDATLNGTQMVGNGNSVSLYTTMLQLSMTLANTVQAGDVLEFKITGGGATFQLGPDVTTNQQIRLGLPSVSTSSLGGANGRLFQLRSDGDAALAVNTKLADLIVQDAISAVTSLRGRLGAIQRCMLDPNIAALQDNLEAMSAAEAEITNADFATESSRLSRAQILIQSGAQTLGIANQMPQYAASLLG